MDASKIVKLLPSKKINIKVSHQDKIDPFIICIYIIYIIYNIYIYNIYNIIYII